MLSLLKRNIGKRFLSGRTLALILICVFAMLFEYQHFEFKFNLEPSYLILEGPFAVFMQVVSPKNSMLLPTILLVVMILYFLESPVVNHDESFFIMRSGKKKWMISEIAGIFCAGAIWIILINLMGCITSCNHMDWTDWKIYSQNVRCMIVYFLAYVSIGMLILLFHVMKIKALGTSVLTGLLLSEDLLLEALPNNIGVISESADAKKILSVIRKYTFMHRMETGSVHSNFAFSVIYFLTIIAVAVVFNMIYARKREIG